MKLSIPECILSIKPYKPGKPISEVEREYGISHSIKLASNENPLGPSPRAVQAMRAAMADLHRYPDASGYDLIHKLAGRLGVSNDQIVLGNGSDDVIGMLVRGFLQPGEEAVMTLPSFLMYEIFVRSVGAVPVFVSMPPEGLNLSAMLEKVSSKTRMVFINSPNNPTGSFVTQDDFARFLNDLPESVLVILDEAYIDFATDPQCLNGLAFLSADRPIAVLRTFSKSYGLAGIRIGYGVMPSEIASVLNRIRQPFNTNLLAQAGALAALEDEAFLIKTRNLIQTEIAFLQESVRGMGLVCYPTQANFFLIHVKKNADLVFEALLREGVIVRSMVSYGYPEHIRVNAGLHEENLRFLNALSRVLKG